MTLEILFFYFKGRDMLLFFLLIKDITFPPRGAIQASVQTLWWEGTIEYFCGLINVSQALSAEGPR